MNRYYLPLVHGGLGDKFYMLSDILTHRSLYEDDSILYLVTNHNNESFIPLGKNAFKSLVNFFHFKSPNFNIETHIVSKDCTTLNDIWVNNLKYNKNFDKINNDLLSLGKYWPIDFVRNEQNKFCWILYEFDKEEHMKFFNKAKSFQLQNEKCVTDVDISKFLTMCEYLPIRNQRLEDRNFAKNVQILSESKFILASEGMWTHLSRAMKIPTIAYSKIKEWIEEMNQQGHFCSPVFEECLFEVMEKAET